MELDFFFFFFGGGEVGVRCAGKRKEKKQLWHMQIVKLVSTCLSEQTNQFFLYVQQPFETVFQSVWVISQRKEKEEK